MHNIQERGRGQTSHINAESSFQLAETVSGQSVLDRLVTLVALHNGGEADISQFEEIEENRPEWKWKKKTTGCQRKLETKLKVKENWRRQTGV